MAPTDFFLTADEPDIDLLITEIDADATLLAGGKTALNSIWAYPDKLYVLMSDALSGPETTALTNVVAAHAGTPAEFVSSVSRVKIAFADSPYTPGTESYILVDPVGGPVVIQLNPAADSKDYVVQLDNASNPVTITPDGAETIAGGSTYVLENAGEGVLIVPGDVTSWRVVDGSKMHFNRANEVSQMPAKGSPVGADILLIEDSADSFKKKKVTITNLPGGADADAIHDNVGAEISAIAEKVTPVAGDLIIIEDSAASNAKKRVQIGNLPGGSGTDADAIHDNVAGEIVAVAEKVSPVGADVLLIEDSAAGNAKKRVQITNLPGGADADAIHDNVAAEINAITEKVSPVGADLILIEDSAAGNAKKKVQITNLPGGADADAIHDNVAGEINSITTKATLVGADILLVEDSAAGNAKKSSTVAGLRITESQITDLAHTTAGGPGTDTTAIHDDTSGEITAIAEKVSPVGADVLLIEDSAAGNAKKRVQISNLPGGGVTGPGSAVDRGRVVWDGTGGDTLADVGLRDYGASATDPVSPAPADGDTYRNTAIDQQMYYDGTRAKWLGDTDQIAFGRSGNVGTGAYYRGPGNRSYSATNGRDARHNGTVIAIEYTRNDTDAATFEVTASGSAIATLASSATSGSDFTLNGDFSAGQVLGARNESGGNTTSQVMGWATWRWRA